MKQWQWPAVALRVADARLSEPLALVDAAGRAGVGDAARDGDASVAPTPLLLSASRGETRRRHVAKSAFGWFHHAFARARGKGFGRDTRTALGQSRGDNDLYVGQGGESAAAMLSCHPSPASPEIENDDIRIPRHDIVDGDAAVRRCGNDFDVRVFLQRRGDQSANHGAIVDDDDANRTAYGRSGVRGLVEGSIGAFSGAQCNQSAQRRRPATP